MLSVKDVRKIMDTTKLNYAAVVVNTEQRLHIRLYPDVRDHSLALAKMTLAFRMAGWKIMPLPAPKAPYYAAQWISVEYIPFSQ